MRCHTEKPGPMTERRCILVVEDEPLVADMLAEALSERYRAVQAGIAAEALTQLGIGECDLVLLDCLLPGGGASHVLEAAEQMGVPVVLMSGDPAPTTQNAMREHPFIAKPFTIEELMRTIDAAIGTSAA